MVKSKDKDKDNELLESKELREKYAGRIEVLENVKGLIMLPNTEILTSQMVAEYYEVSEDVIRQNFVRNKEELTSNGAKTLDGGSLRSLKEKTGLKTRARTLTIFSIDSILCLATLLTLSPVAEKVRGKMSLSDDRDIRKMLINNNNRILKKQREVTQALKKSFKDSLQINTEVPHESYFIDIVISNNSKKMAIEIDEFGHVNYNKEGEQIRERVILKEYDAILRFNPDSEDCIFELINSIVKEML